MGGSDSATGMASEQHERGCLASRTSPFKLSVCNAIVLDDIPLDSCIDWTIVASKPPVLNACSTVIITDVSSEIIYTPPSTLNSRKTNECDITCMLASSLQMGALVRGGAPQQDPGP